MGRSRARGPAARDRLRRRECGLGDRGVGDRGVRADADEFDPAHLALGEALEAGRLRIGDEHDASRAEVALGIDVGGTAIKAGRIRSDGTVEEERSFEWNGVDPGLDILADGGADGSGAWINGLDSVGWMNAVVAKRASWDRDATLRVITPRNGFP